MLFSVFQLLIFTHINHEGLNWFQTEYRNIMYLDNISITGIGDRGWGVEEKEGNSCE